MINLRNSICNAAASHIDLPNFICPPQQGLPTRIYNSVTGVFSWQKEPTIRDRIVAVLTPQTVLALTVGTLGLIFVAKKFAAKQKEISDLEAAAKSSYPWKGLLQAKIAYYKRIETWCQQGDCPKETWTIAKELIANDLKKIASKDILECPSDFVSFLFKYDFPLLQEKTNNFLNKIETSLTSSVLDVGIANCIAYITEEQEELSYWQSMRINSFLTQLFPLRYAMERASIYEDTSKEEIQINLPSVLLHVLSNSISECTADVNSLKEKLESIINIRFTDQII